MGSSRWGEIGREFLKFRRLPQKPAGLARSKLDKNHARRAPSLFTWNPMTKQYAAAGAIHA